MSQQQIASVTRAAILAWQDSESPLSYSTWIVVQKMQKGRYWGAREDI